MIPTWKWRRSELYFPNYILKAMVYTNDSPGYSRKSNQEYWIGPLAGVPGLQVGNIHILIKKKDRPFLGNGLSNTNLHY